MEFKVLSRECFEKFESDKPYIAISITDPNSENAIIGDTANINFLLSLKFHDIDKPLVKREECKTCKGTGIHPLFKDINDGHCYACTDKMDIKLFTDKDAENILDFVKSCKEATDLIVVHCEAGISRSAGVAGALSLIYNGSDKEFFSGYFHPNMLVYRKILNAHMKENYENYNSK